MPHLKELYASKKDEGLVIIGIHTTRGGEKMAEYVKDQEINYPVAIDEDSKTVRAFGGNSYPDYFVIDRAGNLRFADLANAELDRAVELLLAEEAPADMDDDSDDGEDSDDGADGDD